jgi:predicted esterase
MVVFLAFVTMVVGVGGYIVLQQVQLVNTPAQRLMRAAANPEPLPPAGDALNTAPLNGKLYFAALNAQTSYYVLEPIGTMPQRGWPLLMGVHGSGGNGQHMLGIGAKTQPAGYLLVAPTFSPVSPGSPLYDGTYMDTDIQRILREIHARYDIDNNATVLYGFSMGGMTAGGYSALYPGDFDGAGVLGAREIPLPPANSQVRYVVMTGDQDERLPAAREFVRDMANRGTPVWYSEFEAGVGHWMTPRMEDKIIELTESLR